VNNEVSLGGRHKTKHMALDLIIGIFQRRDELANAARALRHEQKPDADLLVVCTLAGWAGAGQAQGRVFSNSGCLKLEPTNPSNTPTARKWEISE
jgi:hypothetical protein